MPYYKSYKNNNKWYVLGAATFLTVLGTLAIHFETEYSEENIKKQQELNQKHIWPTEQHYIPETTLNNKDTITIKDTVLNKDTIDSKLK